MVQVDIFLIVEKIFKAKKVEQTDNFISAWEEEKSLWECNLATL